MEKLYVVVRADISAGDILAQSNHATSQFSRLHRDLHDAWSDNSKNIAVVAIPNEKALADLVRKAAELGIPKAEFYEPDLNHEMTACAFGDGIARHVSQLPCALREPRCLRCKQPGTISAPYCQACA